MIELRQLHHALALVEHGNFARAAEVLHITQPALSRSIQRLERELGARLFDRGPRRVELTEIGRIALAHASNISLASRDLKRDVALAKGLELGELSIGVGPFAASALIGPVVGKISQLYPGLNIKLVVSPWAELPARLRAREVDLVVGEITELQAQEQIEVTPLLPHKFYFVCRHDHPLAAQQVATYAQTLAYPTAGPQLPAHIETALLAVVPADVMSSLRKRGFPVIVCDSSSILKTILINSDAASIMMPFMIEAELRAGLLLAVPGLDLHVCARFCIAHMKGRTPSIPALAFTQMLLAHDAALAASEENMLLMARRKVGETQAQ